MAKKLQQYTIYKFESDRLKDSNYNIQIDLKEARKNNEVVQLGESELIRIIYRLKNKEVNCEELSTLLQQKKKIKKLSGSKENRKKLLCIESQIDEILFIPEIFTVKFTDARHFHQIVKQGLFINGKEYVRLLTGSGMARRSTSLFVEKQFGKILSPILDNDRDKTVPLVSGKYNAYYALLSSAGLPVTIPRICVINDYEYTKERLVDFVVETEGEDDRVEERTIPVSNNVFDGEGLLSKEMALQWSVDLDLEYCPTSFCIRSAYLKGQVIAFDFVKFAEEVAHTYFIKDLWGNTVDVREVDAILTKSQLKLYNCYKSCEEYVSACEKNGIGWSVSRYTPEEEKDVFQSSYQLLQVLDLNEEDLKGLAQPTIDWLSDVSGGDVNKVLLYLLGDICNHDLDEDWWNDLNDPMAKALLLKPEMLSDKYIRNHLAQSLKKKMNDAAMGVLNFNGNWQVAISDPYAFCEHAFGIEVKGLLKEHEHFCSYWNNRKINKVACGRSPLTWVSEMNLLNLKNNDEIQRWFGHLHSGVVINIHGVDTMLFADGDFDFDILFSTDNEYFIKGAQTGKPVTYDKKGATKHIIDEGDLYLSDCATFGSRIGVITNLSTTMYAMLPLFEKDSIEHKTLIERLIVCRKLQGSEIDRAKLMTETTLPAWDKWTRIKETMTPEEKQAAALNNKLVLNRRPRWMIYMYQKYFNQRKWYEGNYYGHVDSLYPEEDVTVDELLDKENKTIEEENICNNYKRFNPFIETDSNLGIISRYVEGEVKKIKLKSKRGKFDLSEIIDCGEQDGDKIRKSRHFYKTFEDGKRDLFVANQNLDNIDQYIKYYRKLMYQEITSNSTEMVKLLVHLTYKKQEMDASFIWHLFGNELIDVLVENSNKMVLVPEQSENGEIEYLGKRYSIKEVQIT